MTWCGEYSKVGNAIDHVGSKSFSSMLITGPPCTTAWIVLHTPLTHQPIECSIRNESGLRCLDIIDVADKMLLGREKPVHLSAAHLAVYFWMIMSNEEVEAWEQHRRRQRGYPRDDRKSKHTIKLGIPGRAKMKGMDA